MTGEKAWFANSAILTMAASTGADPQVVAVLKGFELTPKFEIVELYGMEDIERNAVARHSLKCDVSCKYAMWDAVSDKVMDLFRGGPHADTNPKGAHKNEVGLFCITAVVRNVDDTESMTLVANDVYFDSIPFAFTENEFMVRDLKGTAAGYTVDGVGFTAGV